MKNVPMVETATTEQKDRLIMLWALIHTDWDKFTTEYNEAVSHENGISMTQGIYESALLETKNYKGKRSRKDGDKVDLWLEGWYTTANGKSSRNTMSSKLLPEWVSKSKTTLQKLYNFNMAAKTLTDDYRTCCLEYYSRKNKQSIPEIAETLKFPALKISRAIKRAREVSTACF